VKQILEISNQGESSQKKKELKSKDKKKRPEKVNREVFALIGDVPQMAPVLFENPSQVIKKQKHLNKQVDKWMWKEFDN